MVMRMKSYKDRWKWALVSICTQIHIAKLLTATIFLEIKVINGKVQILSCNFHGEVTNDHYKLCTY